MLGDHRYDINHLPNGDVNIRHTSGGGLTGKPAKTEGVWKNGETAMGSKPPPNIASIIKDVHPDLNAHKPDVMKMMTPEEYHALPKEGEEYDKALMWSKLQGKPDPKYVNNQGAVITKTSNDIGRNEMNTNNITRPYGLNPHNIEDVSSIPAGLSHEIIDYPGHNLRTENITSPTHHVSIEYKNGKFQRGHIAAGEASDIYPGGGIRDIVNTKSFKTMYPHEVESMKRLGVENPKQLRELLDLAKEEATHKLTGVSAPIKPRKPK